MRLALANILTNFLAGKKNGNIGRSASPRPLFLPAPRPFCLPRGILASPGVPACVIFFDAAASPFLASIDATIPPKSAAPTNVYFGSNGTAVGSRGQPRDPKSGPRPLLRRAPVICRADRYRPMGLRADRHGRQKWCHLEVYVTNEARGGPQSPFFTKSTRPLVFERA